MHRPASLRLAVAIGALVVLLAAAPVGGASPTWSLAPNPNRAGALATNLGGVACPSVNSCFAVGLDTTPSGTQSLVKHWNGRSWETMTSPNPTGSTYAALDAIACPTSKSCFAVGSYQIGSRTAAMSEHWNGRTWNRIAVPPSARSTYATLSGVSCPSRKSCFAVGSQRRGSVKFNPFAEHWNGTGWSVMKTPEPTGSTATALYAVSCPSTKSCFAVGSHAFATGTRSLVEHWNGSSWGIMSVANPTNTTASALLGVSCPNVKSCFVVGNYYPNNNLLVEHWNGSSWAIMTGIEPAGSKASTLSGVRCPSPKSCVAVGSARGGSTTETLVEHWDGRKWAIMTSPNPDGSAVAILNVVSCASTTVCAAVGYDTNPNLKSLVLQYA